MEEVADIEKTIDWRKDIEALIMAAQEQALNTNSLEAGVRAQGADCTKISLRQCST